MGTYVPSTSVIVSRGTQQWGIDAGGKSAAVLLGSEQLDQLDSLNSGESSAKDGHGIGSTLAQRKLFQANDTPSQPEVKPVRTLGELILAVTAGEEHIELRGHMDLTALTGDDVQASTTVGAVPGSVKSIRGNCTAAPPTAATFNLTGAPLLPLLPGQCLIIVDKKVQVLFDASDDSNLWLDGIYLRFRKPGRDEELQGGKVLVQNHFWLRSVTMQGNGDGRSLCAECGVWIFGGFYAEDCIFADFGGDNVFYTHLGGTSVFKRTTFQGNTVTEAVITGYSARGNRGGAVWLEQCTFANNTAPALLRTFFWEDDNNPVFYCDRQLEVFHDDESGRRMAPVVNGTTSPLDTFPVHRDTFLTTDNEFYMLTQELPEINRSTPDQDPPDVTVGFRNTFRDPRVQPRGDAQFTPAPAPSAALSPAERAPESAGGEGSQLSAGGIAAVVAAAVVLVVLVAAGGLLARWRRKRQRPSADATGKAAVSEPAIVARLPPDSDLQMLDDRKSVGSSSRQESRVGEAAASERSAIALASGSVSGHSPFVHTRSWETSSLHTAQVTHSSLSSSGLADKINVTVNSSGRTFQVSRSEGGLTTMGMSTMSTRVKGADASPEDRLQAQLQCLVHLRQHRLFEFLKLTPHMGRRVGGQGAVVFAHHVNAPTRQYAIKFFLSQAAFDVEKAAACNKALRAVMPPVALIEDSPQALARATEDLPAPLNEWPLPPLIVTEKGESLDEFAARSAPDFYTTLQVMMHIARKLEALHEAGWVHRDLKPGNAIWLPSSNSWTLIDFGSAARVGHLAEMSFTVKYASPETIEAYNKGQTSIVADSAVDVWALGMMCWELLTGEKFYGPFSGVDAVMQALSGSAPLPTERELQPTVDASLGSGTFRESILRMLSRNAADRPSMSEVLATWAAAFPQPVIRPPQQSLMSLAAQGGAAGAGAVVVPRRGSVGSSGVGDRTDGSTTHVWTAMPQRTSLEDPLQEDES